MNLRPVTLEDKYKLRTGSIYLTGSQALLRLAMNQVWRDEAAGLDTATYITGYRGSPMHNIDKEAWRADRVLEQRKVFFHPAINEDLAATACWGTQQVAAYEGAKYDGVAAIWYGKGPGLDRSIDAIRHANLAGTSRYGGVLAAVGDDPAMKSTDVPAASETMFVDLNMPVLYPATVQEVLDYGIFGWAISRFSGAWVGFKLTADSGYSGSGRRRSAPCQAGDAKHRVSPGWRRNPCRRQLARTGAAVAPSEAHCRNGVRARQYDQSAHH